MVGVRSEGDLGVVRVQGEGDLGVVGVDSLMVVGGQEVKGV